LGFFFKIPLSLISILFYLKNVLKENVDGFEKSPQARRANREPAP
jgi:hypothetical protein